MDTYKDLVRLLELDLKYLDINKQICTFHFHFQSKSLCCSSNQSQIPNSTVKSSKLFLEIQIPTISPLSALVTSAIWFAYPGFSPDIKGFLVDVKPTLLSTRDAEYENSVLNGSGSDCLPREDISGKLTPEVM